MSVWLFAVALPLTFTGFGVWSLFLAARSWSGRSPRPSTSLVASGSARVRRFVDRCILPLGLLYASIGITLGSACASSASGASTGQVFDAVTAVGALVSAVCFTLTVSVYRYWKPARLIPAYRRYDEQLSRPDAAQTDTNG